MTLLRGWAKAYRDTPEHRFPSDPHAEFFPVDMEYAADRIEELTKALEWQPIETAPHAKRVLLGWRDWRDHQWCVEAGPATTGQRFTNGYSTLSQHGSATHWQPISEGPEMPLERSGGAT